MLISHRKKFIYTKTTKTAGTSVESYFEKYCMAEGEWEFAHHRDQHVSDGGIIGCRGPNSKDREWFSHMPAIEIRDKVGDQAWRSYFKFCVIRNPYDKLVSLFFFRAQKGIIESYKKEDPIESFRKWISTRVPVPDRNKYVIDGKICVDYFIRYEDLRNGIDFVCNRLSLPFEPENIPKLKSGIRDQSITLGSFYTEDLVKSVEKAYAYEIRKFGYRLPS